MLAVFYIANRMRKATIKQKSPIASDRANPRIAYEKSCCFSDGFLQNRRDRLLQNPELLLDYAVHVLSITI